VIAIDVIGRPAPQGSKRSIGNNRFIESSKHLPAWRAAVLDAATKAARTKNWETLTGPVELEVTFYLERPATVSAAKRPEPITPPDIDKLIRGVADSLTNAEIYTDDSQIVKVIGIKRYADVRDPGCFITVRHATLTSQLDIEPSLPS